MNSTDQPQAVIEIQASYFPLAFLLAFFKPKASINGGQPFPISWGTTPVPVAPGRYQVDVWLPYLFFTTMGKNGAVIDVPAGGAVRVSWRSPWLVFLQGKITVAGPWPLAEGAPGSQAAPWAGGAGAGGGSWSGGVPTAQPVAAAAPGAGAWHPDPTGRHQHRWYDGAAWTDQVADNGANSTDPIGG